MIKNLRAKKVYAGNINQVAGPPLLTGDINGKNQL